MNKPSILLTQYEYAILKNFINAGKQSFFIGEVGTPIHQITFYRKIIKLNVFRLHTQKIADTTQYFVTNKKTGITKELDEKTYEAMNKNFKEQYEN